MLNARVTDPAESTEAFDPDHARIILAAVQWLYTLNPASDEEIADLYFRNLDSFDWPYCDWESVRKRCSDARRLDKRIQKVGTTKSSHGKTVGVYAYVEVAA